MVETLCIYHQYFIDLIPLDIKPNTLTKLFTKNLLTKQLRIHKITFWHHIQTLTKTILNFTLEIII